MAALGGQDRKERPAICFLRPLGAVLGASWGRLGAWIAVLGRLGAVLGPSWAVLMAKIGPKVDQNSMQKSIIFLMLFEIGFLMDFGRFGEPKWSQVGTKIGSKFDINFEERFLKNRALAAAGARFLRIGGSKLGPKINQKSITKWSRKWSASWHRFLVDFGGFRGPSWGGKSTKNRCKKVSKRR